MYENDIYPNYNTGTSTTGNFSGAQQPTAWPPVPPTAQESNSQPPLPPIIQETTAQPIPPVTQEPATRQISEEPQVQPVEPPMQTVWSPNEAVAEPQPAAEEFHAEVSRPTPEASHAEPQTEQNQAYRSYQTYQPVSAPVRGEKPEKSEKKTGFFSKLLVSVSLGLLFGIFAGIGFYAVQQGMAATQKNEVQEAARPESGKISDAEVLQGNGNAEVYQPASSQVVYTSIESDVSDIVDAVMPAMVSIINNYTQKTYFWGRAYEEELSASGSGIIVGQTDEELLIVSNHHVVAEADQLLVTLIDGTEAEARIKGVDSDMDLAVISVPLNDLSKETKDAIVVATLGNSDALRMGQRVIAIGNALGYGQSTTVGYISALNREIELEDGSVKSFIQTDAAINPGNSGGALLNMAGEVIGINSNKIGGTSIEGMGYAIPITTASPIIADLMERQTRNKVSSSQAGYIGIGYEEVTDQIAQMFSMPKGVYVKAVMEGSGAEAAGMLQGDVIVEFDGNKISSFADLQSVLQYYAVGDTAKVTIMRPENGEYVQYELNVTLGKRPKIDN